MGAWVIYDTLSFHERVSYLQSRRYEMIFRTGSVSMPLVSRARATRTAPDLCGAVAPAAIDGPDVQPRRAPPTSGSRSHFVDRMLRRFPGGKESHMTEYPHYELDA